MVTHFIIAYHISLVKVQTNYCNNNPLTLDVKQLNKNIKLYYFHTLKALWDDQGKIKMYYGMSSVKKQLSEKRSIQIYVTVSWFSINSCLDRKTSKNDNLLFSNLWVNCMF